VAEPLERQLLRLRVVIDGEGHESRVIFVFGIDVEQF
jgi:hypothetical protein